MRRTFVVAAPLSLLALVALACASPEPTREDADELIPNAPVTRTLSSGLRETIRLSDNRPRSGEVFWIESVVVNEGTAPVPVTSRVCGLDVKNDGTVEFGATGFAMCAAYSTQGPLAPGDSVKGAAPVSLNAKHSGTYTLSVRHLLQPDVWVDVAVQVVK